MLTFSLMMARSGQVKSETCLAVLSGRQGVASNSHVAFQEKVQPELHFTMLAIMTMTRRMCFGVFIRMGTGFVGAMVVKVVTGMGIVMLLNMDFASRTTKNVLHTFGTTDHHDDITEGSRQMSNPERQLVQRPINRRFKQSPAF